MIGFFLLVCKSLLLLAVCKPLLFLMVYKFLLFLAVANLRYFQPCALETDKQAQWKWRKRLFIDYCQVHINDLYNCILNIKQILERSIIL